MSQPSNPAAEPTRSPVEGKVDAPRQVDTPRRPGQPGEEAETRPGPSPRSDHPTGPNAPYDPADPDGMAARKHR